VVSAARFEALARLADFLMVFAEGVPAGGVDHLARG